MPLEIGGLAVSIAMAVAAGLVGCFAIMRRMVLAADAISHIALPGVGGSDPVPSWTSLGTA